MSLLWMRLDGTPKYVISVQLYGNNSRVVNLINPLLHYITAVSEPEKTFIVLLTNTNGVIILLWTLLCGCCTGGTSMHS